MATDNFWDRLLEKFKEKESPGIKEQMAVSDSLSYQLYDENGKIKQVSKKEDKDA